MNKLNRLAMVTGLGLMLGVTPSWGGGPPNPTASDEAGNTAGGSLALFQNTPGEDQIGNNGGVVGEGASNTAFGYFALSANTAGSYNTASGAEALYFNTTGNDNTASGFNALFSNTTGDNNTATGLNALQGNTTGNDNTATGQNALFHNITGANNTGSGFNALFRNTTGRSNTANGLDALYTNNGSFNTASGVNALRNNVTGGDNTATGVDALENNNGSFNTAAGFEALVNNTTGKDNTANGYDGLFSNTTGSNNTASGLNALYANNGSNNTASGLDALYKNATGDNNTAGGVGALSNNATGSNNIALGYSAGANLIDGNNDIYIGNLGAVTENRTIRIGAQGLQTRTFVAGISGTNVTGGADVVVNGNGQLGIVKSSARFKDDIRDMGDASERLMKLRPVTFRYKDDPTGILQYGLVAEEVARVYPELVTYGADGKVESVRYSMLTGMLLNELQKQTIENARQAEKVRRLSGQVAELRADRDRDRAQRAAFEARLSAQMVEVKATFQHRLSVLEQTTQARDGGRKLAGYFDR